MAQKIHPIVRELIALIEKNHWEKKFKAAIAEAQSQNVPSIAHIDSVKKYLQYVNDLVEWAPREIGDSRLIYDKIVEFYFFLDQPSLRKLQNPIEPDRTPCVNSKPVGHGKSKKSSKLTPLSQWIVDFANAWGSFLETEASAVHIDSFKTDPTFNYDEYMPPPSGYKTFNQFFARHVKPGMRPVAAPEDDRVLVAPGDSTFVGWWQINQNNDIYVTENPLDIKGILWSIDQLLGCSEYADRFRGGVFTHSFLNTFDYHRWHTPVAGTVLESRVIQGQAYLDVKTKPAIVDGEKVNVLNALDGTGYQFVQTRGLVVIDSPIGLVACLPMGMAQVSSVVITADEGVTLAKGDELGYFQFGGSDFVMVFERSSNVQLIGQKNVHVQQGSWIGNAYPVT
ncbi:MAG: phosphatidylserine decarboxylase [Deltaproteobacteria bacterium]|nr:phosphatidylserine decarboxylase [Deltaproteobacteria bacterium]